MFIWEEYCFTPNVYIFSVGLSVRDFAYKILGHCRKSLPAYQVSSHHPFHQKHWLRILLVH